MRDPGVAFQDPGQIGRVYRLILSRFKHTDLPAQVTADFGDAMPVGAVDQVEQFSIPGQLVGYHGLYRKRTAAL